MRTYMVLIEEPVEARYGDLAFVFLGAVEGKTPRDARRAARVEFGLPDDVELVTVPASAWRAER